MKKLFFKHQNTETPKHRNTETPTQSFSILGSTDAACSVQARTAYVVRRCGTAVLITSLTTSCAFFANCASPIVNIKCFGVFAGLLVLADYVTMMLWLPAVVVMHHRYCRCCERKRKTERDGGSGSGSASASGDGGNGGAAGSSSGESGGAPSSGAPSPGAPPTAAPLRMWERIFKDRLAPFVIRHRYALVTTCLVLGLTGTTLSFIYPRLPPPSSESFQVFKKDNPMELYSLKHLTNFRDGNEQFKFQFKVVVIIGANKIDGSHFHPKGKGNISFDGSFDPFAADAQEYLYKVCEALQKSKVSIATNFDCMWFDALNQLHTPCAPPGVSFTPGRRIAGHGAVVEVFPMSLWKKRPSQSQLKPAASFIKTLDLAPKGMNESITPSAVFLEETMDMGQWSHIAGMLGGAQHTMVRASAVLDINEASTVTFFLTCDDGGYVEEGDGGGRGCLNVARLLYSVQRV